VPLEPRGCPGLEQHLLGRWAKALSVFSSPPPACSPPLTLATPQRQLSTQERQECGVLGEPWPGSWKAWVRVQALPLAGHMMPGTLPSLSGGQGDQNRCVSMEAFRHRAGGHPFQAGLPSPKPPQKATRWTIISGAGPHHASVSVRKTLMCVPSFPADLSTSPARGASP